MKNRWSANTWVLTILAGVIVLIAVDVGRNMLANSANEPGGPQNLHPYAPKFKEGDMAPDFVLPDKDAKEHKLSDLVKRDTLLVFSCGCSNCKDFQTYLGKYIIPKMGNKAPQILSVSSSSPAAEAAWVRDTHLKQTILYEGHGATPVMDQYKGHPCPRAMGLAPDRKVTWIGQSPGELPPDAAVEAVGVEAAEKLGFETMTGKSGIKIPIPKREWRGPAKGETSAPGMVPQLTSPSANAPKLQPGVPIPEGHGPGDGHGH